MQNFNFENELCKIKIPMPFTKLIKNPYYKNSVLKMMGSTASQIPSDIVNLQEEYPKIFIGSALAKKTEKWLKFISTFLYHIGHSWSDDSQLSFGFRCISQSNAKGSHGSFGLKRNKTLSWLVCFWFRVVKCLGVIKDMVVKLTQLPMKSVIMDVVVANITPKFGMLLSRSWAKKVGGTL